MGYTLYDGTIPALRGILGTLSHILKKAEESHSDPQSLLAARLREDMYPIPDHVRIVAQYTEYLLARLSDREAITYDRDLDTFAKCHARIDAVRATLEERVDKDEINRQGDLVKPTTLQPGVEVPMSGSHYTHVVVLPNLYFHLTTAYGILRKEGVALGKRDYYSGWFPLEKETA
ncbi:hypothetical protein QBC47DRAFT_395216 [Echria macrotheca]|uniref:DUF1993 domain-containing protein n=1 Tax=Echria macrotheca TaxID=438768 RepID=A0AAJ0B1E9_9PEZI|nr:hypothetical protein QBC47DRAFT_395216 [Echria macrotheca]